MTENENELISVIVPCYNATKFIDECVNSVLHQIYENFELLLVDDGSTDETGKILDKYALKDPRIRAFHIENSGCGGARNYGVQQSKGVYVAFVDADDVICDRYLDTLYTILKNNNVDMAGCYWCRGEEVPDTFGEPADVAGLLLFDDPGKFMLRIYTDPAFCRSQIVSYNKLVRKEVYVKHPFLKHVINEDVWNTPHIVYECKRIAVSREKLYFYRKHENSIMSGARQTLAWTQFEAWNSHVVFWHEKVNRKLLAIAEQYICHFIYENWMLFPDHKKEIVKIRYTEIVNEMLKSIYLPLRARVKYSTFARPSRLK